MTLSRQHRAKNRKSWDEARAKVERDGGCRNCGSTPVEVAHVVPRSLGGGQSADSVIGLCRPCHEDQHAHRIELLPLLDEAEQLEAVRVLGLARAYRYTTLPEEAA